MLGMLRACDAAPRPLYALFCRSLRISSMSSSSDITVVTAQHSLTAFF